MTPDDVRAMVAELDGKYRQERDDEGAHCTEDAIRHDVLAAIAGGAPDAPALAAEALKTDDLEFSRWYA